MKHTVVYFVELIIECQCALINPLIYLLSITNRWGAHPGWFDWWLAWAVWAAEFLWLCIWSECKTISGRQSSKTPPRAGNPKSLQRQWFDTQNKVATKYFSLSTNDQVICLTMAVRTTLHSVNTEKAAGQTTSVESAQRMCRPAGRCIPWHL